MSGSLKLDYGTFALRARLRKLEILPGRRACAEDQTRRSAAAGSPFPPPRPRAEKSEPALDRARAEFLPQRRDRGLARASRGSNSPSRRSASSALRRRAQGRSRRPRSADRPSLRAALRAARGRRRRAAARAGSGSRPARLRVRRLKSGRRSFSVTPARREPRLAQPGRHPVAMGEQHARQFLPVADVDVEGRLARNALRLAIGAHAPLVDPAARAATAAGPSSPRRAAAVLSSIALQIADRPEAQRAQASPRPPCRRPRAGRRPAARARPSPPPGARIANPRGLSRSEAIFARNLQ